ncbi:MAG TPA: hypothetical protein VJZ77_16475 [Blastocatellia bacterium]|nr:hypothetical protein [Blastocatellia bacterium]
MIENEIRIKASLVAGEQEEYTSDFVVHGIYFGEGDPEQGGRHWNFTRNLGEDDEGVCTVKEIQQVTVYGGIIRFTLARDSVTCEFDEEAAEETGVRKLLIDYNIDDDTWRSLLKQAKFVFDGEEYFEVTS